MNSHLSESCGAQQHAINIILTTRRSYRTYNVYDCGCGPPLGSLGQIASHNEIATAHKTRSLNVTAGHHTLIWTHARLPVLRCPQLGKVVMLMSSTLYLIQSISDSHIELYSS